MPLTYASMRSAGTPLLLSAGAAMLMLGVADAHGNTATGSDGTVERSVDRSAFGQTILEPGDTYRSRTIYRFSAQETPGS